MSTVTAIEPTMVVEAPEPTHDSPSVGSPAPRKPRLWTAFVTVFAAAIAGQVAVIASYFAVGVGVGVVMGAQGAEAAAIQTRVQEIFSQPVVAMLLMFLPCQLGMAAVVWFAARRSRLPIKERLGFLPPTGRQVGPIKLAMLAGFTLSIAWTSLIATNLLFGAPASTDAVTTAVSGGSWATFTLVSIIFAVLPVFVEECLFRGYLQRRLLDRWSPALAVSVSTLLFALTHLDSLQHVIAVVALGFVTGLLAYRTNSIKPGMIVHALHNIVVVAFAAAAPYMLATFGEEKFGLLFLGTIAVLGIVGLTAVISLLRRAKPTSAVETPSTWTYDRNASFPFDSQLVSTTA
ncbi:MAG: lysostaphin resistance A-like protein [Pirellulales bacterium]